MNKGNKKINLFRNSMLKISKPKAQQSIMGKGEDFSRLHILDLVTSHEIEGQG